MSGFEQKYCLTVCIKRGCFSIRHDYLLTDFSTNYEVISLLANKLKFC